MQIEIKQTPTGTEIKVYVKGKLVYATVSTQSVVDIIRILNEISKGIDK